MMPESGENIFLMCCSKLQTFFQNNYNWIFQYTNLRYITVSVNAIGVTALWLFFHTKKFLCFPKHILNSAFHWAFLFIRKIAIDGDSNTIPEEKEEEEEEDISVKFPNLAFYKNLIVSRPDGDYIENILTRWRGNNDILEKHHFYIQWLFPNRMHGVNSEAAVLKDEEATIISESPELRERLKKAFEMMLEFYGMRLTRDNQFELAENGEERLAEINYWGNHNFLRISRILLALRDLGHQELMLPWAKFLANLIFKERLLSCAAESFENYWIQTLDAEDKILLIQYKNILQSYKEI